MNIVNTFIKDLLVIEPDVHGDSRGWFLESYNEQTYKKSGINIKFVQDNHSFSTQKGVLRGLHFQNNPFAQSKLVRCTHGRIWDVAVDLRKSSPTYMKWFGIELSEKNHKLLFIPQGFAHGFLTLETDCEVQYKVDNFYDKMSDKSILYNDPQIGIDWPIQHVILSEKDKNAPMFKDLDVDFL
jgi:dTDP-4-dehydrorhamnose 3,5-epimerase